jgi:hypothetical protein
MFRFLPNDREIKVAHARSPEPLLTHRIGCFLWGQGAETCLPRQ